MTWTACSWRTRRTWSPLLPHLHLHPLQGQGLLHSMYMHRDRDMHRDMHRDMRTLKHRDRDRDMHRDMHRYRDGDRDRDILPRSPRPLAPTPLARWSLSPWKRCHLSKVFGWSARRGKLSMLHSIHILPSEPLC